MTSLSFRYIKLTSDTSGISTPSVKSTHSSKPKHHKRDMGDGFTRISRILTRMSVPVGTGVLAARVRVTSLEVKELRPRPSNMASTPHKLHNPQLDDN